jgi:hypothetical protein
VVFGGGGDRALVRVVPDDATDPRLRPIDRREARDVGPPGSGGLPRNGAIDALREGGRSEGTGRDRPSRDRLDRFSGIEADRAWQQRIGEVDGHAEQQRPGQTAHRHVACPDVAAPVKTTGGGTTSPLRPPLDVLPVRTLEPDDPSERAPDHGSRAQYCTGGSHRRSALGVTSGSQIGTRDHHPSLAGTGRYFVEQPHGI